MPSEENFLWCPGLHKAQTIASRNHWAVVATFAYSFLNSASVWNLGLSRLVIFNKYTSEKLLVLLWAQTNGVLPTGFHAFWKSMEQLLPSDPHTPDNSLGSVHWNSWEHRHRKTRLHPPPNLWTTRCKNWIKGERRSKECTYESKDGLDTSAY